MFDVPDRLLETYEAVPYDSRPIHLARVGSLELIARLHGLTPRASDGCRVLELGCASGGHLIPMAAQLPGARFVGIDLAPGQVADGQAMIRSLGLENITLRAMSIADVTRDFGEFDYVICHGVYSWVPPEVQDAILRVCSENLAPAGIAYVSYNVYPGWHARGLARDMMMFHDDPSLPPDARVVRARSFMDTIAAAASNDGSPPSVYAAALAQEITVLREQGDAHLLHEQLEPFNNPVYFSEFAHRASLHGLRYVADAKLRANPIDLPAWLVALLDGRLTDVVRVQQYLDFARGVAFRRTLLCHESLTPSPAPNAGAVRDCQLVVRAAPVKASDEVLEQTAGKAQAFRSVDDVVVTTVDGIVIAALRALLSAAPRGLQYADLARRVEECLRLDAPPGISTDPANRDEHLANAMLHCAMHGLIELYRHVPVIVSTATERPVAHIVARQKAQKASAVPNLQHYAVSVSGLERLILIHLDGTNTRDTLLALVEEAITDGRLTTGGEQPTRAQLASSIDDALRRFADTALLEA